MEVGWFRAQNSKRPSNMHGCCGSVRIQRHRMMNYAGCLVKWPAAEAQQLVNLLRRATEALMWHLLSLRLFQEQAVCDKPSEAGTGSQSPQRIHIVLASTSLSLAAVDLFTTMSTTMLISRSTAAVTVPAHPASPAATAPAAPPSGVAARRGPAASGAPSSPRGTTWGA